MESSQFTVDGTVIPRWRQTYKCVPGVYDEMCSAPAALRPHWRTFINRLDALDSSELSRRWEHGRHLIHENGVTYNVYGDPKGMERPWELDPIPFIVAAPEWSDLESALIQRAQLLNLVLADIYGSQALLRANVLPPELVFGHPGFLRPCHGIIRENKSFLDLYSADVVRRPDGRWTVIADRTQAPSGAGYVLENRIVISRIFPDAFKECQVHRISTFFRQLRESLASLAPYNRDNPRIVLLTPGPFNETYFEHAFLARYLNYTLVEGGDLTVRDGCVFLKTLGGLHRVDVILRRLDDDWCDPLELRGESSLGVPGLVQAARSGNVAIANPLGSGVLETPALNAFLPALCRHLLREDLRLPSVNTYWCGQDKSLQFVLENLSRMVIKPTFPSRGTHPVFCARLSQNDLAVMKQKIQARPHNFVAQEQIDLSHVPVLVNDSIQPRNAVLRTYLARTKDKYAVMPGGLTQVPTTSETLVFSLQRGGGSKDTWVQAHGPVSTFSMLQPATQRLAISRGGGDLPSRVADNLFWLGRYLERAENMVRLLRGIVNRLSEKSATGEVHELPALIAALCHQRHTSISGGADIAEKLSIKDELNFVLAESFKDGGLYSTLKALHSVSRPVRDRLSTDTWRVIMSLNEGTVWPQAMAQEHIGEILARLNFMLIGLASFGGLASESMTRGQVWQFLDMGRRLERSVNIASLLRSTVVKMRHEEPPLLEALLEIADSLMTYRRRYLSNLQLAPLLDLLLSDDTNPRSMAFQMNALNDHVEKLPRDPSAPHLTPEQRITLAAVSDLKLVKIHELAEMNGEESREGLDKLLLRMEQSMADLSDLITRDYLSHAAASRQLAAFRTEVL